MRLLLPPLALASILVLPSLAEASPFAIPTSNRIQLIGVASPAEDEAEAAPTDDSTASEVPTGDDAALDEIATRDPTEGEVVEDEDDELEEQLAGKPKKGDFNANAFGIFGGIQLVPSYFLNQALASYANSVCRNKVGKWGEENGLVKVGGCNFYMGGGYTRRISRAFDIGVGVGYLHIRPPDSMWIDNDEWDRKSCTVDQGGASTCNLGAADYTSIDLRMITLEVNFTGRGTLYRNADVEIQLGGGGGVGAGILVGAGVKRTPLGSDPMGYSGNMATPGTCTTLADTADFRRCTPRYYDDPDIDQDGDGLVADVSREDVHNGAPLPKGNATSTGNSFASCSRDKCTGSDLAMFGTTETGGTWPVYPLVNIFGSFRVIIKDTFGITIDGGIKNGFFFGGGMQYYFGGGGYNKT